MLKIISWIVPLFTYCHAFCFMLKLFVVSKYLFEFIFDFLWVTYTIYGLQFWRLRLIFDDTSRLLSENWIDQGKYALINRDQILTKLLSILVSKIILNVLTAVLAWLKKNAYRFFVLERIITAQLVVALWRFMIWKSWHL